MAHVDLDAARAARNEAKGGPHSVTFAGRDYKLVAELTIEASMLWRTTVAPADGTEDVDAARELIAVVLADPSEADDFWAAGPSWGDINAIVTLLAGREDAEGESPASPPSPPKGGKRSRPTSPRTTTST